jgi:cobalt-zinc-cadmium efflux system protein
VVAVVMVLEVAGGLFSGSLALLADAAHMGTDALALLLALVASRLRERSGGPRHSYGLRRAPVLSAFANGLLLLGLSGWVVAEAVQRVMEPPPVLAGPMLGVAIVGLLANVVAFALLHGGDRTDLNLRGALLHVIGDMLGSVAAIVAALVMLSTGWMLADPLLSVGVAGLVGFAALNLLRQSAHILLEGAPAGVELERLERELPGRVPGLADVHHLHVWSLAPEETLLTCHARVAAGADPDAVRAALRATLVEHYGIGHATIETERVDRDPCAAPPC